MDDWDLELEEGRARSDLTATDGKASPRLVHKVMFSMPAGTPPAKVLNAVKNFSREEFALKHRYVMALHTDESHPHVHVVIKAIGEQGQRLNIRKATLRRWRMDFARHLRALGVPANATQRYVRGEIAIRKQDQIYRPGLRGESIHMRERTEGVARELEAGALEVEGEKAAMIQTRSEVVRAWQAVSDILVTRKQADLARQVRQFAAQMPPVMTEKEFLAARLLERQRRRSPMERSATPSRFTPPHRSR